MADARSHPSRGPSGAKPPLEPELRIIGLFAFWFLISLALVSCGVSLGIEGSDLLVLDAFEALVTAFPPLLWLHLRLSRSGRGVENLLGRLPEERRWGRWTIAGLALAGFGLGTGWASVSLLNAGLPSVLRELEETRGGQPLAWPLGLTLWRLVDAALLTPFVLELVFRGAVLRRFAFLWGGRRGIEVSVLLYAVLYGLGSLDPLGAAAVALVTTLLYLETRTLWVPIFVHAVANLVQIGVALALESGVGATGVPVQLEALRWPATIAALIAAPLLVLEVRRSSANAKPGLPELEPELDRQREVAGPS